MAASGSWPHMVGCVNSVKSAVTDLMKRCFTFLSSTEAAPHTHGVIIDVTSYVIALTVGSL